MLIAKILAEAGHLKEEYGEYPDWISLTADALIRVRNEFDEHTTMISIASDVKAIFGMRLVQPLLDKQHEEFCVGYDVDTMIVSKLAEDADNTSCGSMPILTDDPSLVVVCIDSEIIRVTGCVDCPFRGSYDMQAMYCKYDRSVDGMSQYVEFSYIERHAMSMNRFRPTWCKLTAAGVRVYVDEGGEEDADSKS